MKKIALFIGELSAEFQRSVCAAIEKECKERGYQLTVFQNFTVFGTNVFHSLGERSVIRIADLSKYDGFVIAPDTFSVEGMYGELAESLQTLGEVPVVSLRQEVEHFHNILVDDYPAMYEIVDHLITKHGLTRICFMKGLEHYKDAQIRLQAYLDAMDAHGLSVNEHMTFNGDYWRGKGAEAVEWFLNGEKPPQAIVCANDFMAISVMNALQKKGLKIPEDVVVTGFDDREEAIFADVPMTSVHVDIDLLSAKAIQMIENLWNQKEVPRSESIPAECCFRESCGCMQQDRTSQQNALFTVKEHLSNAINQINFMNVDCESVNTIEGLFKVAANFVLGDETIYLCFCDENEKNIEKLEMEGKYTKYMELRAILTNRHAEIVNQRFLREEILPEGYLKENQTILINALHDKNDCLGYIVVTPLLTEQMRAFYQMWVQCLTTAITRIRMTGQNRQMTDMMNLLNKDELTGMYNRRELDRVLRKAHDNLSSNGKSYYVISIDMDGLKYINDTFGHLVGDEALCSMADIIERSVEDVGVAARVGGDEFTICCLEDDEFLVKRIIQRIRDEIEAFNSHDGKNYELSASIGYARCNRGSTPLNCIQMADTEMYREKRNKKNARID